MPEAIVVRISKVGLPQGQRQEEGIDYVELDVRGCFLLWRNEAKVHSSLWYEDCLVFAVTNTITEEAKTSMLKDMLTRFGFGILSMIGSICYLTASRPDIRQSFIFMAVQEVDNYGFFSTVKREYCCCALPNCCARLVSAGSTMILLVVILPAGCFVSAGSYGLCCWFRVHAGGHTSAGGFISADRVCVPAVCMVSAVGCLFLLAEYIHAAGVVYAANTSIYAAELFDIAGWLVSATSHLVSAGSLQSCWCNNVSAA
ncbi:hypothetical protein Tco_1524313 [Tanacetum coccineum]